MKEGGFGRAEPVQNPPSILFSSWIPGNPLELSRKRHPSFMKIRYSIYQPMLILRYGILLQYRYLNISFKVNTAGVGDILGAAQIEAAICHGCGTCVSECPARAIQLMHYTDAQTLTKLDAMFGFETKEPGFIPLEKVEVAP